MLNTFSNTFQKQKGPDQTARTFYSLIPSPVLSVSGSMGMFSGQFETNHPLREKELQFIYLTNDASSSSSIHNFTAIWMQGLTRDIRSVFAC